MQQHDSDHHEQNNNESALTQSERFLQTIIETEPNCIKLLARDGTLLMMNQAGLAMIQAKSFDSVRGTRMGSLIVPAYRNAFTNVNAEAFQGRSGILEFESD